MWCWEKNSSFFFGLPQNSNTSLYVTTWLVFPIKILTVEFTFLRVFFPGNFILIIMSESLESKNSKVRFSAIHPILKLNFHNTIWFDSFNQNLKQNIFFLYKKSWMNLCLCRYLQGFFLDRNCPELAPKKCTRFFEQFFRRIYKSDFLHWGSCQIIHSWRGKNQKLRSSRGEFEL